MIVLAIVCFVLVVAGFTVLLLIAASTVEPGNQRTTYHEFRHSNHRRRCTRHTRNQPLT